MATLPKQKKTQELDESLTLARFHRAIRDEDAMKMDMWSLPLETLGVCHRLHRYYWLTGIPNTGLGTLMKTFTFRHFLHE